MRHWRLGRPRTQRGFTLIECIMSLAVLGVALAAVFQTLHLSAASNRYARELTAATSIANTYLDHIKRRATAWVPQQANQPKCYDAPATTLGCEGAYWRNVFPDLPLTNDLDATPLWGSTGHCNDLEEFCPVTRILDQPNLAPLDTDDNTDRWHLNDEGTFVPSVAAPGFATNDTYILEYRATDVGFMLDPNHTNDLVRFTVRVSWSNKSHGGTSGQDYHGTADAWNRRAVILDTIITGYHITEQGT